MEEFICSLQEKQHNDPRYIDMKIIKNYVIQSRGLIYNTGCLEHNDFITMRYYGIGLVVHRAAQLLLLDSVGSSQCVTVSQRLFYIGNFIFYTCGVSFRKTFRPLFRVRNTCVSVWFKHNADSIQLIHDYKQWLISKIIGAGTHQFKSCTETNILMFYISV